MRLAGITRQAGPLLFVAALLWAIIALGGLARARQARDAAIAAQPPVLALSASNGMLHTRDVAAAGTLLAGSLADHAAAAGVRLSLAAPIADAGSGFVRQSILASGPEVRIRTFADSIETGTPAARLLRWSIDSNGGVIRLRGEIVAPWRPR